MNFAGWVIACLIAAICGHLIAKHELRQAGAQTNVIYRSECDWIPTLEGNRCSLMGTEIPEFENRQWIKGNETKPIWI